MEIKSIPMKSDQGKIGNMGQGKIHQLWRLNKPE